MGKYKKKDFSCKRADCFAYRDGFCNALNDTDFNGRPCPFYKPKDPTEELKQQNNNK